MISVYEGIFKFNRTSGASGGVGKKYPGWDCKRWRGLQK
jgi:hypothetical protein